MKNASPVVLAAVAHGGSVSASASTAPTPKKKTSTLRSMLPILASAFCAAAIMYPIDLVRALQMANAGMNLSTKELLVNFHKAHGLKGTVNINQNSF